MMCFCILPSLRNLLLSFEFIMELFFSVIMHGVYKGFFKSSRGLSQGDLFLLSFTEAIPKKGLKDTLGTTR